VKSFAGERLAAADIGPRGLAGDRLHALEDPATANLMSAKKHPRLLELGAACIDGPDGAPRVRIAFPDGTTCAVDDPAAIAPLAAILGRRVRIVSTAPAVSRAYDVDQRSEIPGIPAEGGTLPCPPGSFHDLAPLHLLSTGTIAALARLHPQGRFDVRRFRPNVVIETDGAAADFPEDAWIGSCLRIGAALRLMIPGPTIRCVMTTLAQDDLPRDPEVLRTAARHHQANVGCYALVQSGGTIRVGDTVTLSPGEEP
jgi:uncharacterized protein YcbX